MATSRVLRIPGFLRYCLLQAMSIICTGMQSAVMPVFVFKETGSDMALAACWITSVLPSCFLSVGGAAADYYNRSAILLITQGALLLQALMLGFIAITWSGSVDRFILIALLVLHCLASLVKVFEEPARTAFKSELVPENDTGLLEEALRYYGAIGALSWRVGLGIGGLLMISLKNPAPTCFLLNAASYLLGIAAVLIIRRQAHSPVSDRRSRSSVHPISYSSWLQALREGARFIAAKRQIGLLFFQTMVVVLFCKRYEPLLPAFAERDLGSVDYAGWLRIAMAIGALLGFLFVQKFMRLGVGSRWSYHAMLAFALVQLGLFLLAQEPIATSLALGTAAAILLVQESFCNASIQSRAAKEIQGRVFAFGASIIAAIELFLALPMGWAATIYGVRPVLITSAALGVIVAVPLWLFARQSKTIHSQDTDDGSDRTVCL
jgi:hypothetical protein